MSESKELLSLTSLTPRAQKYDPSFAVFQLNPPYSVLRPEEGPLITYSERERKRAQIKFLSTNKVSPNFKSEFYLTEAYPSSSECDIRNDEGDEDGKILCHCPMTR